MKKLLLITFLAAFYFITPIQSSNAAHVVVQSELTYTIRSRRESHSTQVQGTGIVSRVLADDNHGSRHQRFILRLRSGQTLLIAHNIDIAPRVTGLKKGATVEFSGEYTWNSKGGVVHWTHRDPSGKHVAGWLRYNGRIFQ